MVADWHLPLEKLKHYPHFDSAISAKEAEALAKNAARVAAHTFFPFLLFTKSWTKYADRGLPGKLKERPIRYAARRDSYIFSYYRHILSEEYEDVLSKVGLSNNVIAYRRIEMPGGNGSKSNIEHAADIFSEVRRQENCCALTFDISSFFESMDHALLKAAWCDLLGVRHLPKDHFSVFKAITAYAVIDKKAAYERLGIIGDKVLPSGKIQKGYLKSFKEIPRQLCRGKEFREKLAGGDGRPTLIEKNLKNYGIPQGAPISDLLANIYLLKFDLSMSREVSRAGGVYRRYSDDIIIVLPVGKIEAEAWAIRVREEIKKHGKKIKIKEEKCSLHEFSMTKSGQVCSLVSGTQGRNGLEYLGFRFDGRRVYLRDSTLSNLLRKMKAAAKREARKLCDYHPLEGAATLKKRANVDAFRKRFGRVEDFEELNADAMKTGRSKSARRGVLTFWSYATRAHGRFEDIGSGIARQTASQKKIAREWLYAAIDDRCKALGRPVP